MVRIGGKSKPASTPAPAPAAAKPSAPAPATTQAKAPAPAPTPAPAATPAAPQQPQVTNIYVSHAPTPAHGAGSAMGGGSSGPGFMGMMAASIGGAVIGNGISHMLFDKSEPAKPEQSAQLQQAYAGTSCQPMITNYAKCLENNGGSADACKWAWESFTECEAKLPKA